MPPFAITRCYGRLLRSAIGEEVCTRHPWPWGAYVVGEVGAEVGHAEWIFEVIISHVRVCEFDLLPKNIKSKRQTGSKEHVAHIGSHLQYHVALLWQTSSPLRPTKPPRQCRAFRYS